MSNIPDEFRGFDKSELNVIAYTFQWAFTHGALRFVDRTKLLQEPQFRGVALILFRQNHRIPEVDITIKRFVTTLYNTLPLTTPLCDLIINYC